MANIDEIQKELTANVKAANDYSGASIDRMNSDLQFSGGLQFDKKDDINFGVDRPKMVVNLVRGYANQIINPYRANPFGVMVSSTYRKTAQKAKDIQAVIRGIESRSVAKKAYVTGIDRQVKGGRGYLGATTEYVNGQSFDQHIKIVQIPDPAMVVWDHFDRSVDGGDGQWCVLAEHISPAMAENKYSYVKPKYASDCSLIEGTRWSAPEGSIELLHYFRLRKTPSKIYQNPDGTIAKEGEVRKNSKLRSRSTTKTVVECYRFVGKEQIGEMVELPLSRLPIIPVLGEMVDLGGGKMDYVGITYFARDPAKLVNWITSLTAERISAAPRAATYVDFKGIAQYKDFWLQEPQPKVLPYDGTDAEGKVQYKTPQDRDISVNISDVSTAQASFQGLLSSVLGMQQGGSENGQGLNETATSVLTRSLSADMANFQFADNLALSIKALGTVLLELIPTIYDTNRPMQMIDAEGVSETIDVNPSEWDIVPEEYQMDVDAGPMLASRKREALAQLIALGGMLGPEAALVIGPDIVRNTEMPDSDAIADKMEIYARAKLGLEDSTGGEDPEAVAALQAAQSGMEQLSTQLQQANLYIQQLTQQVIANQEAEKTKVLIAQMNNENKIQIEAMKANSTLTKTQMEIVAEADKDTMAAQAEVAKAEASAPNITVISGLKPSMPAVGGMRNDIFQ